MSAGEKLKGTPVPMHFWEGASKNLIAGDSWGDPNNTAIMLLHGGGQTRHAWKGTGELLANAGYYAIAIDARGHGDSDWATDGAYSQELMVEDLVCVLTALNCPSPVLVGASMGGISSLIAIGEDYVRAKGLVMVDIAPQTEPSGVKRIGDFMAYKPEGFDSLQEAADWISAYQPHRKSTSNLSGLAKNLRLNSMGKYSWHWDPKFMTMRSEIKNREARLNDCTWALTVPTMLVRGGLSDILSEKGAAHFLSLRPESEYVNITGAAHMVAGDRNDIFGKSILDFLERKT
jgi:pimeloyl-ACP methyl ester carboxylesterase